MAEIFRHVPGRPPTSSGLVINPEPPVSNGNLASDSTSYRRRPGTQSSKVPNFSKATLRSSNVREALRVREREMLEQSKLRQSANDTSRKIGSSILYGTGGDLFDYYALSHAVWNRGHHNVTFNSYEKEKVAEEYTEILRENSLTDLP